MIGIGGGGDCYSSWPIGADSGGAVTSVASDVLVKYTYFGDADLDGQVDNSTTTCGGRLVSPSSLTGWLFGDFDYDGSVDYATDYDLWWSAGRQPVKAPRWCRRRAAGARAQHAAAWRCWVWPEWR